MKLWHTAYIRRRNGHDRVLRGGNWFNDERNLRSAYRNHNEPDNRNNNIGLRLAGALQQCKQTGWSTAEGSVNQLSDTFAVCIKRCDKRKGAGRASKHRVDARRVESLPRRRTACLYARQH